MSANPTPQPAPVPAEVEAAIDELLGCAEDVFDSSVLIYQRSRDALATARLALLALYRVPVQGEAVATFHGYVNRCDWDAARQGCSPLTVHDRKHQWDYVAVTVSASPVPPAPSSAETPEGEAPITDAERIDAICRTVGATTDGVVIHDATPDWSVVVENDGEVCGRGEDVRGALDELVRQDRMVTKVLAEHRAALPPSAPAQETP